MDEESAINALVDHLEDEMEVDEEDPSAVNMEVASTGKVTARKEDGTRVATPVGSQPVPRTLSGPRAPSALARQLAAPSTRALSYAAAMATTPQDWHIEFSVNDQPISPDTT
jgi:E3 ubiquitin-protein ligase TRIP12